MIDREFSEKRVNDILTIISGDIVDLKENKGTNEEVPIVIDAIVNAAKPTLMGGSGVDGAIHNKVGALLRQQGSVETDNSSSDTRSNEELFNLKIKEELEEDEKSPDFKIRCKEGEAVTTEIDMESKGFVKYIINAVGPKYDGGAICVRTLRKCYESIMKEVFLYGDIKKVAIPVISSGNYGFPFELALRVAIATIGNCLITEKHENYDNFCRLEKVFLVIYEERHHLETDAIYKKFEKQIVAEERMVYWGAVERQIAYCSEILKNDSAKRRYFTITKGFRLFLAGSRFLFPISMGIEKCVTRYSWKRQREVAEICTLFRTFIPLLNLIFVQVLQKSDPGWLNSHIWVLVMLCGFSAYFMADTIICLMSLIFLTDLHEPSANRLRTIILLIFNYIGMFLGIAQFYYTYFWNRITIWQALDYSILGIASIEEKPMTLWLRMIEYSRAGIQFFFIVLTFTFFVSHLHQRQYIE